MPRFLIAEQFRHVGNRGASKLKSPSFLFSHTLALSDGFPGRSRYGLTICWRPIPLLAPQQALQADTFAADLHAAVHLDPHLRICVEPGGNSMQRHDDVLLGIRRVCQEPADRTTIEVRKSRKFHGGHCAVSSFDLSDGRTGKAERFGGFALID